MERNIKYFNKIERYTKEQFKNVTKQKGTMYLVREHANDENPGEVEIWFGTRMYATNKKDELTDINCGTFKKNMK